MGLKIPPILIVIEPVWANFTATTEPTDRWLACAVVVSISNSPAAIAAAPLPDVIWSLTVFERWAGDAATSVESEPRNSNCPW